MANYAAAVRTANHFSRTLLEKHPSEVLSVTPKMVNASDAVIQIGVSTLDIREQLPTYLSLIDEKDELTNDQVPVVIEFATGNAFHRQGHR